MLSVESTLKFPDSTSIRFFGGDHADALVASILKRNVFARHSRENDFYVQRVRALSNRSVIEVFRPGDPNDMGDEAERVADLAEKLAILSSTLVLQKQKLQTKLGISSRRQSEIDFIIGSELRYLRSRSRSVPCVQGIKVDDRFCRRFARCGFPELYRCCLSNGDVQTRLRSALDWLFESRREPSLPASVVKTAIALESLLIISESEPLARTLSERAAFILSSSPAIRQRISRMLKRFYDARSGVVHGSKRKLRCLSPSLVEAVDRLGILLCLTIGNNSCLWPSVEDLRTWCETQRWGTPSLDVAVPYPDLYLNNALNLG